MKNVAIYLRLSHADNDLGENDKDESNSIENQRALLTDYIERSDDLKGVVEEYVDDGYTGTNFDRPGFQKMIEDAKKGRIGTILVKDLSRLGRDYIGVGDYLEQIFPSLGIRVIAINSNYDSDKYSGNTVGMDISITNLVNSLYSKDLSKKVRSGKMTKWKNGISTAEMQPFGYIRDPLKQNEWIIEEDAAKIVRLVFSKAVDGWTTHQITDLLNELHLPTPSQLYREKHGYQWKAKVKEKENIWDMCKVWRMITNYAYTGNVVRGKKTRIIVGSTQSRKVPEKDRIIIKNAIPSIISEETFNKAQLVIQRRGTDNKGNDRGHALTNKIKCGNCGLSMTYKVKSGLALFCRHGKVSGKVSTCPKIDYPAPIIENQVYRVIKQQINAILELGEKIEAVRGEKAKKQKGIRQTVEEKKQLLKQEKIRLYESFAAEHISLEVYSEKKKRVDQELCELNAKIKEMDSVDEEANELQYEIDRVAKKADRAMKKDKLTRDMANCFIETVYVYDLHRIEVNLKFNDLFKEAEIWLSNNAV